MNQSDAYKMLDQPLVLNRLFHPRPELVPRPAQPGRDDVMIPAGDGVDIGASFFTAGDDAPVVMFFHGNGEIVADYDDIAEVFVRAGLSFFVVDYRGYGRSGGHPTVSDMLSDCHMISEYVQNYQKEKKLTGPLCVMGRSLGSASAIELVSADPAPYHCLIVESGFAKISPLLRVLGLDPAQIGFVEDTGMENVDKIKKVTLPTLIIHAQYDHIIPFSDGQQLFDAGGAKKKMLQEIKGANHNDIFFKGLAEYMQQVQVICTP